MGELKCEMLRDGIQFGQSNGLHFVTTYSLDSRLMAKCGRKAWKNLNSTRNFLPINLKYSNEMVRFFSHIMEQKFRFTMNIPKHFTTKEI